MYIVADTIRSVLHRLPFSGHMSSFKKLKSLIKVEPAHFEICTKLNVSVGSRLTTRLGEYAALASTESRRGCAPRSCDVIDN